MIDTYRIRLPDSRDPIPFENRSDRLEEARLVFLMGCPRSGTTFLLSCLAALPRAQARSGILIPVRLCHVVGAAPDGDERTEDLLHSFRDNLWKTFVSGITSRAFHTRDAMRHPTLARPAFEVLAGRRRLDPSRYVLAYKEPFMAFAASRLAAHFRTARILHLIRDGRDCADSMDRTYGNALSDEVLRADRTLWRQVGAEIGVARRFEDRMVPWWVAEGEEREFLRASRIERYLWMWRESVERAREARSVAGDRYTELRYEDLCRDPRAAGEVLTTFLGVEGSPRFDRTLRRARVSSVGIADRRGGSDPPPATRQLLRDLGYLGEETEGPSVDVRAAGR
ncbi:MAG TPA: sulfotransferase [Gemmatimonadota bacterium]|nr:sulfotransferase [Gemmatimonadota bacterium]